MSRLGNGKDKVKTSPIWRERGRKGEKEPTKGRKNQNGTIMFHTAEGCVDLSSVETSDVLYKVFAARIRKRTILQFVLTGARFADASRAELELCAAIFVAIRHSCWVCCVCGTCRARPRAVIAFCLRMHEATSRRFPAYILMFFSLSSPSLSLLSTARPPNHSQPQQEARCQDKHARLGGAQGEEEG